MAKLLLRPAAALLPLLLLAACGGDEPQSIRNDTARQEALIANQAAAIAAEAENGTRLIEQALENETANIFENRDALLNATGNEAAAGNSAR